MVCLCKNQLAAAMDATADLSAAADLAATLPAPPIPSAMLSAGTAGAGGDPDFSLLAAIQGLSLPPISLTAALPQLSAMISAALVCSAKLGISLPGGKAELSAMLGSFDPSSLAPLMSLNASGMANLSAYASAAAQMKAQFGAYPWDTNLSAQISEAFGGGGGVALSATLSPPVPPGIAAEIAPKLPQIASLNALASLSASLGADLGSPGGLASFSASLAPLAGISLPSVSISPALSMRLSQVASIMSTFGAGGLGSIQAQLSAMLSLQLPLPKISASFGTPTLPTQQQLNLIGGLDLNALASANWQVPDLPPLAAALPGISAIANLSLLGPVLQLSPCGAGCPMGAFSMPSASMAAGGLSASASLA
jgi:hypothetical protein